MSDLVVTAGDGVADPVVYGMAVRVDGYPGTAVHCPYCRRVHVHGRGGGNRVPHCGAGDYYQVREMSLS